MTRHALFLDRDGTLIVDVGYPREASRVQLLPGVIPPLLAAAANGWALVIVSNQSGVGRGLITRDEAASVQMRVEALFAAEGVRFDGAYFCIHEPSERCRCRKPKPAMILDAARDLRIELEGSVMIGDKASDVQCGRAAGCRTVAFAAMGRLGEAEAEADADADAACASWGEVHAWLEGPTGPFRSAR